MVEAMEFFDEDNKPSLDEMLKINEQMIQSSKNKKQLQKSHFWIPSPELNFFETAKATAPIKAALKITKTVCA